MNDLEIFRHLNKFEKTMITNSFSKISLKLLPVFKEIEKFLYIFISNQTTQKNYPKIYLFSEKLENFLQNTKTQMDVYSGGLYFGFIKKSIFFLSLEGAEFLYKNEIFSEFQHLSLNKKGEKSFLYGNNISKKMIDKIPQKLKNKDFLLVLNGLNEIIGISQSQCDHQIIHTLNSEEIVAINLSDKGYYLRKKQ